MSHPVATAPFNINSVAVKLPEFWTDNVKVWFAQSKAQFAVRGVNSSLTKFYYCVGALNHANASQVVDLIEFSPEENPYKFLMEHLTELHTLNPFQRFQVLMALTWRSSPP